MEVDRPGPAERLNTGPVTVPRQAASVILLRDGDAGLELLMVRRSPAQGFMAGFWVFPGGTVNAEEGSGDAAHRAAAVRELAEEAGVAGVTAAELVKHSRWVTPEQISTRFDTHFFLAAAPPGARPRPDGRECVEARWTEPRRALQNHRDGAFPLAFPTVRQLEELSAFASAAEAIASARASEVHPIRPRVILDGDAPRVVLPGEPGYD